MPKQKIVILGAGFAGLWLACQLLKQEYEVEILEKEGEVGGLLRTLRYEDFYLDLGPHIYFASHKHYFEEFLPNLLQPLQAYYGFAFRGRQIRSPLTPQNLFAGLSLWDTFCLTTSFIWNKHSHSPDKSVSQNAEEWCIAKYGKRAYSYFFKDYIPKVTGLPAHKVAPEWGTERERFYKEHNLWQQSLKPLVKLLRRELGHGKGLWLYYLPKGSCQIPRALEDYVVRQGGVIRLCAGVRKIIRGENLNIKRVAFTENDTLKEIEGDLFVNTLPLSELVRYIKPVPPSICRAAHALKFRNLWLFYYVINRPFLTDKVQIYFPEKDYLFKRVYEVRPLQNRPTRTAICVEVCYSENDTISRMSEEELSPLLKEQLMRFYQLKPEELLHILSHKVPFAYAIYERYYQKHLATIASFLFTLDNLISYGRSALFRYNLLTDRIIDGGETTLRYIMSGRTKREFLGDVNPKGDFL